MEKRYISNRYKKASSEDRKKRRKQSISSKMHSQLNVKSEEAPSHITKKKKSSKNKMNVARKVGKLQWILVILTLTLLILSIVRFITKKPNESFFDFFKVSVKESHIEELNIAVVDNADLSAFNNKNIISTELNNYVDGVLLKVNTDYSITYELLDEVEKISNNEYILSISNQNSLTASKLKEALQSYMEKGSKYYMNCKNISKITELDNKTAKVELLWPDPMFLYNLQLPVQFNSSDTGIYVLDVTNKNKEEVSYVVKNVDNEEVPRQITLRTIKDDNTAVELYSNGNLDAFITNDYSIGEKIGKTEFNMYSYKNGNCQFLIGNKNSKLFSRKEIRQAIAYSIDRDRIKKEVYLNTGFQIDVPYLYSDLKYKYDIYAAQNILLSNGYSLKNGVFSKDGVKVSLRLLVNKDDEIKVKIATRIKEDLEKIGIEAIIDTTKPKDIESKINKGSFDIAIVDININENPNLDFINDYININDAVDNQLNKISEAEELQHLTEEVKKTIELVSDEVVCIGLHADSTYLVSKKEYDIFKNISYMNIFGDLLLTESN